MAGIEDYSTTPGSNTSINGISVAEGMPPSNVNDAFRQMMADVRREESMTSLTSSVTISIGEAAGGKIHIITDANKSISAFDTIAAGIERTLIFDVAATLVHDATKLKMPHLVSVSVTAGDTVQFLSEGSGNWRALNHPQSVVVTLAGTQTLTNKTINASSNTITNIGQTEIAASAVGQGELKTTTAAGSTSVSSGTPASHTLTGGTYSWWTASADSALQGVGFANDNVAAGVIGVLQTSGSNGNFYVDERYVQASPPYSLGHGNIALFVFVVMAADGSLRGINVAPDPVWAYHGPTNITPERRDKRTGKSFRRYREVNGVPFSTAMKDASLLRQYLSGDLQVDLVEREITYEIKNRDMDLFPHTWVGNELTGHTVVLLDPTSQLVDRLAVLHAESGASEIRRLIEAKYLTIDNTPLDCATPRGVVACRAAWK